MTGQFLPINRDRLFGNSLSRFIGRNPGLMPIPIPFFPFPFRESVPSCVFYMQGGPYDRTVSPDESGQALREWKPGVDDHPDIWGRLLLNAAMHLFCHMCFSM
jgi:hypothetical protein